MSLISAVVDFLKPNAPIDPALALRVWQLIARARPAGIALQLMAEGQVLYPKESTS